MENDFTPNIDSGKSRQPETSSVMEWLEERSFLFGLELRGEDENFIVPLQNQGGQQQSETLRLTNIYLEQECVPAATLDPI